MDNHSFFPRGPWRGVAWASPNSVSLYWAAVIQRLGKSLQSCWKKWVMICTGRDFLFINWSWDCLFYSWSVSRQGLKVVQSPRFTSVTRRAAGLPMLILCICSAGETSKTRSLLCQSMQTLLETAKAPLPDNWDQTLDLPQVAPHSHTREEIWPFNHGHRWGHTLILAFTGVCGSHYASPGPWFQSGSCCASVCSWCSHPVAHSAQFSLLGHEKCSSAALQ